MDISKRLLQITEYMNLTANSFAVKIGVSQPRFRNYLNGRAPDYETLSHICKTFVMINERWLLTGEGEMLKNQSRQIDEIAYPEPIFIQQLSQKDNVIIEQAKTIGKLEGKVEYLEDELKKRRELDAEYAYIQDIANVG